MAQPAAAPAPAPERIVAAPERIVAAPERIVAAPGASMTGPGSPPRPHVSREADAGEREHLRPVMRHPVMATGGRAVPDGRAGLPNGHDGGASCTVAQLRRFIKSRPWVPMHELRRRFGINGDEDDVTPIVVGAQRLYIGLPSAEGRLVAELLSGGDVGFELSLDPTVPMVVGVYPMRPVPRG